MLLQIRCFKAHNLGCLCYCKVALAKLTSKASYVIAKSLLQSSQARILMLLQSRCREVHRQGCLCYCKVTLVKLTSKAAYVTAKSLS